ncbi:hypothetical protein ACNHUS_23190 [Actinomycetes bacterium M1A6_2h]
MAIRISELAKQCGLTSAQALHEIRNFGEFVKSASSKVEEPVARRLRDRYPSAALPQPEDDIVRSYAQGRIPEVSTRPPIQIPTAQPGARPIYRSSLEAEAEHRKRRQRCSAESLSPVARIILEVVVAPNAQDPKNKPRTYYQDEVEAANRRHRDWVNAQLASPVTISDRQIIEWVRLHGDVLPSLALRLTGLGLRPQDVDLHLWYGIERFDRPSLLNRIRWGELSAEEAAKQVVEYRRSSA